MTTSKQTAVAGGWAVVLGVLAFAPLAVGQQATAPAAEHNAAVAQTQNAGHAQGVNAQVFRGSELMGLNVQNQQGESIGEIHDIVINPANGRAAYVALSVGGVAGIGDSLFAVPFDAFHFTADDNDERAVQADGDLSNVVARLNVSKDALNERQGFNQDAWPNFADANWRMTNDQAYESVRQRDRAASDDELAGNLVRLSDVIGLNVENAADENVGEVNDVVVDSSTGHVRYVALSVGGFLGMGDKLFAIPLKAFSMTKDDDGEIDATLPVTKESFDNIAGFDQDHWPSFSDQSWRDQNDRSYESWQANRPAGAVR